MNKKIESPISSTANNAFQNIVYHFTQPSLKFLSGTTEGIPNWLFVNDLLSRMTTTKQCTTKRGIETGLNPGEVDASLSALAESWKLGRKVVTRLINEMEACGIVSRESSNVTTILALTCVIGWISDGTFIQNPHSNFRRKK
jgi:hypothetical protein